MPSEVDDGYFPLHSEFCRMGQDYLLGVEFGESITDLDYGSGEGLPASVSHSQMRKSFTGSDVTWRSNLFRAVDVPDCHNNKFHVRSSALTEVPSFDVCNLLVEDKPSSFPRYKNINDLHDNLNRSFQATLPDKNGGRQPLSGEIFRSQRGEKSNYSEQSEKSDDSELTGSADQEGNGIIYHGSAAKRSMEASCMGILSTHKRSRKPTKRYIDEIPDPSTHSKKRRVVSSSTHKGKTPVVKDHKKSHVGSRAMKLPAEEPSVKAIQVPFGSLIHKECSNGHANDMHADGRNLPTTSKGKHVPPGNQKKRNEYIRAVQLKIRDENVVSHKTRDSSVTSVQKSTEEYPESQKVRDACINSVQKRRGDEQTTTTTNQKKKNDSPVDVNSMKRGEPLALITPHQKKRDCLTAKKSGEVSSKRKHHIVWTISEIRKLIDGVSQYGVGRWSRIKKLFFSASSHRTPVDIKDKWRNLLKACGLQEQGSQQGGKKRSAPWRPLPKSILHRVCELAAMHPYPKGRMPMLTNFPHNSPDRSSTDMSNSPHDSPVRSADMTLSDYRRILRSISSS